MHRGEAMIGKDKDKVTGIYESRYKEMGCDIKTLGWRCEKEQRLRFRILTEIGDLSNKRVCDVGCGFGDLYSYLAARFPGISYTGVDIAPSLIENAKKLHPDLRFMCKDITEEDFTERFDYFLLSGALNLRLERNEELTESMLTKMFSLADVGVAVNFLTTYVNYEKELNYHHNPEKVFALAKSLTRWVSLRHDYPLWEFTIYLYKDHAPEEE